ncbi:unnamed protein product [Arctia plantaginis]|uniref:Uncharacterized protein n=1 Tax=Arctia plantaginis TaxID=874455 RepID=A0A8S1B4F8_ARCPL|nr:unnamed protein product [Arctia plantaginis]
MPRSSRPRVQLSEEEKKARRREQKKMIMRRARAKLGAVALEERRRKDRERYHQKKQDGLIRTIKDFTPRQQRQMRKMWREKSRLKREKEKIRKRTEEMLNENTPPSSPCSASSRVALGKIIRLRNRRLLMTQNQNLLKRLNVLERRLDKYRMRFIRIKKSKTRGNDLKTNIKRKICEFLNDDENSRITAGKKETITRKKVKKQIRLLNDTLINLHKKFKSTAGVNVSYETFRRYRPFWVIFPKAASRKTCLCSVHTNINFVVCALYKTRVLPYSSATELVKSLCCSLNINCLERKCTECNQRLPLFNIVNGTDTITYQRWVTKAFTEIIKGKEKLCKKNIKESVKTSQQLLVNCLKLKLPTFMQHLANIINQHTVIRAIKENLTPLDGLLHIDFSENYCCKYGSEIQSAHFGGSKRQLSLHTCVYYSADYPPPTNFIKTSSICSVSENLRHDPVLICAHLTPVVERIKLLSPDLKNLHILSDGPTTQYRNKTMFYMIVNYLSKISNAETITWHFSEAGHGKGAPDGVGGCVKRTADNFVAHGGDVTNIQDFVSCLQDRCKGIEIIPIDDTLITEIQNVANGNKCHPFKGTFKIHQLTWTAAEPNILHARRLSCISCATNANCPHFEIGQIQVMYISDTSIISSDAHSSPSSVPSPTLSHGTASASTVSGLRLPLSPLMCTPSPNRSDNATPKPFTPRKSFF